MAFREPEPRHVEPEDKLTELNFRDRVLFNALDRYPGCVCWDLTPPFSNIKQMKLIRSIFDLIDYEGLRSEYKTLKPSIVVDLSEDYYDVLKEYSPPGYPDEANERLKAFNDLHAWLLWSLSNWVNLELYIDLANRDSDQGRWFDDAGNDLMKGNRGDNTAVLGKITTPDYTSDELDPWRIIYPDSSSGDFQAKLWVGGENTTDSEYQPGVVKCVVAYLRSLDCQTSDDSFSAPYNSDTFQLQQWRNRDLTYTPAEWDDKWQLKVNDFSGDNIYFVRKERPIVDEATDNLTFTINCDKFVDTGSNEYTYQLISLELLEEKLHLMSKHPLANPIYTHIEEDLDLQKVFSDLQELKDAGVHLYEDEGQTVEISNNPVVDFGTFTPTSTPVTLNVQPLCFYVLEPRGGGEFDFRSVSMSDFILAITPQNP